MIKQCHEKCDEQELTEINLFIHYISLDHEENIDTHMWHAQW